jgi:two-component system, OmpR family, sensor histidine kinase KdpD
MGPRRTSGSVGALDRARRPTGWVIAVVAPVALTLVLLQVRSEVDISSVLLLFLLTVLGAAAVGGLGPALTASVLGFLLVNWFFTPPYHTLEIEHVDNVLALLVFLLVGGVVSWYGATVGRRSAEVASAQAGTELRNALLAAVSHDLRTPLASIKASVTSLLADDVTWPPEVTREFTVTIDEETDRLTYLVANLLDMSRLATGAVPVRMVPVGVDELVFTAVGSLGDRAGRAHLSIDVDEGLPGVETDPSLVERAIANVVDNALAWSPDGEVVLVDAVAGPKQVQVRVVDHGPGIPVDARATMFLPFQRHGDRSNGAGVGLGLAVARGLLVAVGGELAVEDTPGGGTTMVISMPRHDQIAL